ncbi:MAG: tetratricopeptide (TPR) repeat protein [Hyphomicrobiaceae bacterium]|jgi:tetratricopeptide (TPR) repeat protein
MLSQAVNANSGQGATMLKFPRLWTRTLATLALIAASPVQQAWSQSQSTPPAKPPIEDPDTQVDRKQAPSIGGKTPSQITPGGKIAKKPSKPASPLDLLMKDGIPAHAEKRAVLREDLYALLATSANAKEAKKIARQLQLVWRTSGSDTVSVLFTRATRALKAKDKKLALTLLDSVVELAPDNAEAWNRRAFIHYSSKDYRSAVGDLRRALALDKSHFKALDGLASIFQQIGDEAKALKVYEQLRQIHPFWPGLDKAYKELKGKVRGRGI